jgi:hypothetical protein
VEHELHAVQDAEPHTRRIEYRIGPRRTEKLVELTARARALRAEFPDRPWVLRAAVDVRWGELVPVLDLLRDLGIDEPVFARE